MECRELQEKYGVASFGSYGTGHRDSIESVSMLPPEPSAASAVLSQQTLSPLGDRPLVCSMPDVLTLAADVLNAPRSKGTGRGQEPGGGGGGGKKSTS